jgi:hypothetical protein
MPKQLTVIDGIQQTVKTERIAALRKRREELTSLAVTHRADVELRNELLREIDAEIKQLETGDA